MIKKLLSFSLVCLLVVSCSIKSPPISVDERYAEAQADVKTLFSPQKIFPRKLDYYEALARALKYNLDYRIRLANAALQAGQLSVAEFTMFPALNTSGSIYTRSNDLSTINTTTDGSLTNISNSTPRTLRSARIGLTWNILDFGLGYIRAKQQGERILIAEEEVRKQEQNLAQDVLVAYWNAYNAQRLIQETQDFQKLLMTAKEHLMKAESDKLVPQENILQYQGALLEGNRRLLQLQFKYEKAMLDLRHLINLYPDQQFLLAPPPEALSKPQNLRTLDLKKLDAITMVKRPELRGQDYQHQIAQYGIETTILQALPGITLNDGWNYNSNKFLLNNKWMDRSVDVAWNLLNLVSLPTSYHAAKLQVKYEELKRLALTIAVLTEAHFAYWRYQTLSDEYLVAHRQTENADKLYQLLANRQLASLASEQQVILARLKSITLKMEEQLLTSDLSTALGQLYLSTGSDILPMDVENESIATLTEKIKSKFLLAKTFEFNQYVNNTYAELILPIQKKAEPLLQKASTPTLADWLYPKHKSAQHTLPATQLATNDQYTLQIFGSYNLAAVKQLSSTVKSSTPLHIGHTMHEGKDWYVLTLGHFDKVATTKNYLSTLSTPLKKLSPWVRKSNDIQWIA